MKEEVEESASGLVIDQGKTSDTLGKHEYSNIKNQKTGVAVSVDGLPNKMSSQRDLLNKNNRVSDGLSDYHDVRVCDVNSNSDISL